MTYFIFKMLVQKLFYSELIFESLPISDFQCSDVNLKHSARNLYFLSKSMLQISANNQFNVQMDTSWKLNTTVWQDCCITHVLNLYLMRSMFSLCLLISHMCNEIIILLQSPEKISNIYGFKPFNSKYLFSIYFDLHSNFP